MRARWMAVVLSVMGCAGMGLAETPPSQGRAWTPADSVALRYFLYDLDQLEPLTGGIRQASPAALSPDGRHFFFVSFSGDLARDESIGQISVFAVQPVMAALREGRAQLDPLHLIELRSRRGGDWMAPILQPRWADATTLEFVGTEGEGSKQLYQVDIASGERVQLSQAAPGEDVERAEVGRRPGEPASLIYTTSGHVLKDGPLDMPLNQYPSAAVRPERLRDDPLFSVFHPWKSWIPTSRVYARYQGEAPRLLVEEGALGPWLSPDGRHAVLGLPVTSIPAAWQTYEWRAHEAPLDSTRGPLHQFHLVDLRTGEMRPLLDAPVGPTGDRRSLFRGAAFWSADGARVLLVNTRLPLSDERAEVKREAYIIDYRLADGQWREVAQIPADTGRFIYEAQWAQPHEQVLLKWATSDLKPADENTQLSVRAGQWRSRTVPSSPASSADSSQWPAGLKVYVQEGMNTPQTMVAERAGRRVALSAPDPALVGIYRQPWERMDIADGERRIRGYLLRPVRSMQPSPLVILLADGAVYDEQFIPDGARFSGFAGQSLAAQGVAVLHMDSPQIIRGTSMADMKVDNPIVLTPAEGPAHVRAVDAAISQLAVDGRVDASRVGLVGFSRSGYHVNYVITHPGEHRIGAAVIFDSYTGGYGSYVNSMAIGRNLSGFPRQYALAAAQGEVPTFWHNKQGWLDAPAFNLERVRTPALFTVTGIHNTWSMLETVGGWRHMQLPFEYRIYPQGSHVLTRPREQEDALRGTVEWMGFWLQGQAPQDESRAQAWKAMQARWQDRLKVIDAAD